MGPTLLNSREASVEADRWQTTTSARLRRRARRYRLAAAVAECHQDEVMLCDLAMMFDQIAYEFRPFENDRPRVSVGNEPIDRRASGVGRWFELVGETRSISA
jgi:hypothetical protein